MRWQAKEPFNSYSHLLGVLLSIAGLVVLVVQSQGHSLRVVGFSIYGVSLILFYLASAIYHGLELSPRGEDLLRRFDHIAIFVLIAGSYTPVCLVTLRGGWAGACSRWCGVWPSPGTVLKLFFQHLPSWLRAALYVGMGWLAVMAIGPLAHTLPSRGLAVALRRRACVHGRRRDLCHGAPGPVPAGLWASRDLSHLCPRRQRAALRLHVAVRL